MVNTAAGRHRPRRLRLAPILTPLGLLGLVVGGLAAPAAADTTPPAGVPKTVAARSLPTWQVDGVVWSTALVGNIVYAVGSFETARPPGVAPGGAGTQTAKNFFAFDITTGNPVGIWHNFNAQARDVAVSPDGKKLYVVGDFTRVDGGQARAHIAVFDAVTGQLLPDIGGTDGRIQGVSASGDTVYVGGLFNAANGQSRKNLAAFKADGSGVTSWAPSTDHVVRSVLYVNGKVVVGGQFDKVNNTTVNGMTSLHPTTGAVSSWKINTSIRNSGPSAGVTSLSTDGSYVYGAGFHFGSGNFEGPWAANISDGSIHWVADCLGDTYDTKAIGEVVYTVGHAHDCSMVDSFPEASNRRWTRGVAVTKAAHGVNNGPNAYGKNFKGVPKPNVLNWWPEIPMGDYTGQGQGPWTVEGNGQYVVLGGEFPKVDHVDQQGLARFAMTSTAPPRYQTAPVRTVKDPTATAGPGGQIKIDFQSAWDPDNETLTYEVYRDYRTARQALVGTVKQATNFWTLPDLSVTDMPDTEGSYTYTVRVTDGTGNEVVSKATPAVTGGATQGAYAQTVRNDGATGYWRLGEASGTVVNDVIGTGAGATAGTVLRKTSGAIAGDAGTATTFVAGTAGLGGAATAAPQTFSYELWFKTGSTKGGKLFGFHSAKTGAGTSDRNLSMNADGSLRLAIGGRTLAAPGKYNDNAWHQAVVTKGAGGTKLYVDGAQVAADAAATSAGTLNGYWRINGDAAPDWSGADPASSYIDAALDDISVYPTALPAERVNAHYRGATGG